MHHPRISSYQEVLDSVKARYPILYIVSSEEQRVEESLKEIAQKREKATQRDMSVIAWSITGGYSIIWGNLKRPDVKDPIKVLEDIASLKEGRGIIVLRDFHAFFGDPKVVRKLRDLANDSRKPERDPKYFYQIVILSAVTKVPPELEKDLSIIDWDLPDKDELRGVVEKAKAKLPEGASAGIADTAAGVEKIADATLGLTRIEAENVLVKSLVRHKTFELSTILGEKKHIIRKSGILEYYEAQEELDEIGGMETLKRWLTKRKDAFTEKAVKFGLPLPKGILLIGVPGCGKSLTAKAIGANWQMPLLRLDVGKIFGGLVGASEENIRKALKTAEAVAPAVLWLDEMEKGFSGTGSSNMSDGGTTSRVFGTFVTWMQEKTSPVFVIATANDVRALPPELLRKGRFDEIFFVDLPSVEERKQILGIHLKKKGRTVDGLKLDKVVSAMPEYSGSEIEQVVISAMYEAFEANPEVRELTTEQLLQAAEEIVPLSMTMREGIAAMREWAKTRARMASRDGTDSNRAAAPQRDRFAVSE